MTQITATVTPIADYPKLGDTHIIFREKADIAWNGLYVLAPQINSFIEQLNTVTEEIDAISTDISEAEANAQNSMVEAQSAAYSVTSNEYIGDWTAGEYTVSQQVSYLDRLYTAKKTTTEEPTQNSSTSDWYFHGVFTSGTPINGIVSLVFLGDKMEDIGEVFYLKSGVVAPATDYPLAQNIGLQEFPKVDLNNAYTYTALTWDGTHFWVNPTNTPTILKLNENMVVIETKYFNENVIDIAIGEGFFFCVSINGTDILKYEDTGSNNLSLLATIPGNGHHTSVTLHQGSLFTNDIRYASSGIIVPIDINTMIKGGILLYSGDHFLRLTSDGTFLIASDDGTTPLYHYINISTTLVEKTWQSSTDTISLAYSDTLHILDGSGVIEVDEAVGLLPHSIDSNTGLSNFVRVS
ncbi:MAG: hypothetical protein QM493_02510 [Sulfurovum sp.]